MEADTSAPEFEVNEYITLRLEDGTTNIYVNGKLFRACKAFVFQTDTKNAREFDDIDSIDDLIGRTYDLRLDIDPETEFWGHCSNLHAWVEHDYDTRLLDMRLAFPILRLMAKAGNSRARVRFEEEVIMRYNEGSEHVRTAMMAMGLLHELKGYDYLYSLIEDEQADYLVSMLARLELKAEIMDFIPAYSEKDKVYLVLRNRNIERITIPISDDCPEIPWELSKLPHLTNLAVYVNGFSGNAIKMEKEGMSFPKVEGLSVNPRNIGSKNINIEFFESFPAVESFGLSGYRKWATETVFHLSDSISACKNIEDIGIEFCCVNRIPEALSELPRLERIVIRHVEIKKGSFPMKILSSGRFQAIQLQSKQIEEFPRNIIYANNNLRYFVANKSLITNEMRKWFRNRKFHQTPTSLITRHNGDPEKVEGWAKIPVMWNFGF